MSRIDDIIEQIRRGYARENGEQSPHLEAGLTRAEAKSELLILLVEVIGEDEKTEKRGPLWDVACQDCFEIPEDHTRNQLKAEQRKKAKELFGVEE